MNDELRMYGLGAALTVLVFAILWVRKRRYRAALDHVARVFGGQFIPAAEQVRAKVGGRNLSVAIKSKVVYGQDSDNRSMELELVLTRRCGLYLGPVRRGGAKVEVLDYSADATASTKLVVNGVELEAEDLTRSVAARLQSDDALRSALVHFVGIGGTVQGLSLCLRPRTWNAMVADGRKLEELVRAMLAFALLLEDQDA